MVDRRSSVGGNRPGDGPGSGNGSIPPPIITEDVEIRGEIAAAGPLEFNGRLQGDLRSGGELVIGDAAVIGGTVGAQTADISGKIKGDVVARRVRLRPGAMVYGSVMGGAIAIEEGAMVEATIVPDRPARAAQDTGTVFRKLSGGGAGRARRPPNSAEN